MCCYLTILFWVLIAVVTLQGLWLFMEMNCFSLFTMELQNRHCSCYTGVSRVDFGTCFDGAIRCLFFPQKQEILDLFSSILYECVTQETPEMLPAYIAMDQVWFKVDCVLVRLILCFK